jgi:hypothetical protein
MLSDEKEKCMLTLPSRKVIAAISVLLTLLVNNLIMTAGTKIYATNDGRIPTRTEEPLSEALPADPARTSVEPRSASVSVGQYSSLALTSSNLPVISYYDETDYDLKLAVCNDAACMSPTISTIDSAGDVGQYSSLALTSSNLPVISYYDATNENLKLAVCSNAACTSPTISTIDSAGNVGMYTSLAVTSSNVPVISYHDETNGDLKLAVCSNPTCSSAVISTLDSTGVVGIYTSIAVTASNLPVISYQDFTYGDLKLAVCTNTACTSPIISTIDSTDFAGLHTSIALTSSNLPVISYTELFNGDLKLAVCSDAACTSPTITTLDSTGLVGYFTSVAVTPSNLPIISYTDATNYALKLAVCDDATCTSPTISTFDGTGFVGYFTSIALTSSTVPVISYYDYTSKNLKLLYVPAPVLVDEGKPNSFAKVTPAKNATIASTTTTFTWDAISNATSYEYCMATSTAACTTWTNTGTSTTATNTGLEHNTTYYWQVRAINAAGTTYADSTSFGQFTVVFPPAAFNLTSPPNNASKQPTTVTLTWAASTRAASYEYCIALTQAACTNWQSTGNKSTVAVSGLAKGKSYFWQVRAKNTGGTTISSGGYRKFTTRK